MDKTVCNQLYCFFVSGTIMPYGDFLFLINLMDTERTSYGNPLYYTFGNYFLFFPIIKLIFYRGTATVKR
ncbi:hypothetical protein ES705_48533 [subsurface metagenome]